MIMERRRKIMISHCTRRQSEIIQSQRDLLVDEQDEKRKCRKGTHFLERTSRNKLLRAGLL